MGHQVILPLYLILLIWGLASCDHGPKVIEQSQESTSLEEESSSTGIFSDDGVVEPVPTVDGEEIHAVEVLEVLPTKRYVYLRVAENDHEYWIATSKQEVAVGQKYFYKSGIFKRNFKSTEYNRVFEELYLVSSIVPANHSQMMQGDEVEVSNPSISTAELESFRKKSGSVRIADLVSHPEDYQGKVVQVSGLCVKVNPHIMDKNWIHLKDGSKDDYDFVITSSTLVLENQLVTLKGVINLNRDFGAGYRYDILMEDAEVIKTQ